MTPNEAFMSAEQLTARGLNYILKPMKLSDTKDLTTVPRRSSLVQPGNSQADSKIRHFYGRTASPSTSTARLPTTFEYRPSSPGTEPMTPQPSPKRKKKKKRKRRSSSVEEDELRTASLPKGISLLILNSLLPLDARKDAFT